MEFKVLNEDEVQTYLTDKRHIVISVQDPDQPFVQLPEQISRVGYLRLAFHDLEFPIPQCKDSNIFNKNHVRQIQEAITYARNYNYIDLICVNCVAGMSRSPAIAAALSYILNGPGTELYFFGAFTPNNLVFKTIINEWEKKT